MKNIFLITLLLFNINVFSQNTINKSETIFFNSKEIKNYNKTKKIYISKSDNQPFIAFNAIIKGSFETEIDFYIRYKKKQWSSWEKIENDIHVNKKGFIHKQLYYLPQSVNIVEVKLSSNEKINIESVALVFFYPEFTKNLSAKAKNNQINKASPTPPTNCSCPIPSYEARLDWCPSGNCPPQSNPTSTTVTHLIVHHSAGSNSSSDWAARVRSIWNYHVNSNGWSDIGYNYLIDPNGVIYEGRGNNILGAHFSGMNTGTMGICLIGNYDPATGNATPSNAMINSLEELLSWKECDISADPLTSSYHNASSQNLMHIAGHRDAGTGTVCPGDNVYNLLPNIRTACSSYMQTCSFGVSDLVVSSLSSNPSSPTENQNTNLLFAVANTGSADVIENITVDLKIDGSTVQTYTLDSILSGQVLNFSYPNYQFTNAGNHNLCLYISSVINETNMANNSYCTTINVQQAVTLYSDLIVNALYTNPSLVIENQNSDLNFAIGNSGALDVNETINIDLKVDGNTVQTYSIDSIQSGQVLNFSYPNYQFLSTGNHSLCLYISSASNELNTANNSYCTTINVQNATINTIDLLVSALSISPNTIYENDNTNIQFSIINNGNTDVNQSFNLDLIIDGNIVNTYNVDTILSNEVKSFSYGNYHFSNAGTFSVCVKIDTISGETNITNNNYCNNVSIEAAQNSDLVVSFLSTNPNSVTANENTEIAFSIKNIGISDAIETLNVDLKINNTIIQSFTIDSILSNETIAFSYPNYQFLDTGNHAICVSVANASNEINYNNNAYCMNTNVATDIIENADVLVLDIIPSINQANVNEAINFQINIKNDGNIASSEPVVSKIKIDGILKQSFTLPILNPSENFTKSFDYQFYSPGNHSICINIESPSNEVIINNNSQCISFPISAIDNINSIENISALTVYPNPSTDFFIIDIELFQQENVSLKLYNNLGKTVFSSHSENKKLVYNENINTSKLNAGIYFLEIKVGQNRLNRKIIIK